MNKSHQQNYKPKILKRLHQKYLPLFPHRHLTWSAHEQKMQNLATMKMSCFNVINAKRKHAKQERCSYKQGADKRWSTCTLAMAFSFLRSSPRLLVPSFRSRFSVGLIGKLGDGIAKCVTSHHEKLRQVFKKLFVCFFVVNSENQFERWAISLQNEFNNRKRFVVGWGGSDPATLPLKSDHHSSTYTTRKVSPNYYVPRWFQSQTYLIHHTPNIDDNYLIETSNNMSCTLCCLDGYYLLEISYVTEELIYARKKNKKKQIWREGQPVRTVCDQPKVNNRAPL